VLDGATENGLIDEENGTITLTDHGRAEHARIATRVERTRATVLGDLTPDQYADTVQTLSMMADNVQADLVSRPA
jgi:DNA-binding MarR family transcriptional regulator